MEIAPYKIPKCLILIGEAMNIVVTNQEAVCYEENALLDEKENFRSVFDKQWKRLETEMLATQKAMYHLEQAQAAVKQIEEANK